MALMEGQFQTSFIPKRPIVQNIPGLKQKPRRRNLLTVISSVIVVTVLLIALGVFVYQWYLNRQITNVKSQLDAAVQQLQPSLINQLVTLDKQIETTKTLLNQHIAFSHFFDILGQVTLTTVRFTSFQYILGDQAIRVSMSGQARGFSDVALQAAEFNNPDVLKYFQDPTFTNLGLDEKTGSVTFNFTASLRPDMFSYAKITSGAEQVPTLNVISTTTISTSTTQH